jgi:hypothetical protein
VAEEDMALRNDINIRISPDTEESLGMSSTVINDTTFGPSLDEFILSLLSTELIRSSAFVTASVTK